MYKSNRETVDWKIFAILTFAFINEPQKSNTMILFRHIIVAFQTNNARKLKHETSLYLRIMSRRRAEKC